MAIKVQGDEIYQDFTFSQRPANVRPSELEEIANRSCVQDFITEMQQVTAIGSDKNYGFDDSMLGVINSCRDEGLRQKIREVAQDVREKVGEIKYVVHCGIGGSELGATMAITATGRRDIKYFPITSLNNDHIARILDEIEPEKTLLIKATRSNTTKETLTGFDIFANALKEKLGDKYSSHCVAILGKDKKKEATDKGYHFVPIEPKMSGRYTGLHAANLFTAYIMGVDIDALHEGARHMLKRCTESKTIEDNPALEVAVYTYLMNTTRGKTIFNAGVFSPDLVKYGDWLGQLVEESLGHREDISITTKTSELSDKAHSYFQGWLEGANTTYHQFVFPIGQKEREIVVGPETGETLRDIEYAEYKGISKALANAGRPSYTTFMKSINEKAIGQLMMRDMIATMFLGQFYDLKQEFIDSNLTDFGYYNQPGVEAYKVLMKAELKNLDKLHDELGKLEEMFA